jgi:glyoxylase-like metal-dependent hydrolase (beta-lactamase superfamily II)
MMLKDGQVLEMGSLRIEVIHTPGHTKGSCCFLVKDQEENILLSGDTLFAQSVGRTDLPGGDPRALEVSLRKLAQMPDELKVFPGHGPETVIGAERVNNPFWPTEN